MDIFSKRDNSKMLKGGTRFDNLVLNVVQVHVAVLVIQSQ